MLICLHKLIIEEKEPDPLNEVMFEEPKYSY